MGIPIFILGESGTGKSTSLRNFKPGEFGLIQAVKKPLPFRSQLTYCTKDGGDIVVADQEEKIIRCINGFANRQGKGVVVIDDFQYTMANEFMNRSSEKGFDKFTEIAKHAWSIIMHVMNLPGDVRVYFLSHTQTNEYGEVKAKTIGKLLDEKITLEGLFSIVLKTQIENGNYYFQTKNDGKSTVKSPLDMFSENLIENDLKLVDDQIKSYYQLEQ